MSKGKTTAELLERLAEDQRILKQDQERLEFIREKELSQQEIERTAKSVNVVEELGKVTKLLAEQDKTLKEQVKTLASLEKQKKGVLAEKEQLENSVQREVDQLMQDHSDLSRERVIGLEKVEQEIQRQALNDITEKTIEELSTVQVQLEEKIKIFKQHEQNYKNLGEKVALSEDIEQTQRKITVLEGIAEARDDGMTLAQIKDDEAYKSFSDDDRNIIEKYLEQNPKGEFVNNSLKLEWEKNDEERKLQELKQKVEALKIDPIIAEEIELLELAKSVQENYSLGSIEVLEEQLESVKEQLLIEQQKLPLDPNKIQELEVEVVTLEGNIKILVDLSVKLQNLTKEQQIKVQQFVEHQDLQGVDIIRKEERVRLNIMVAIFMNIAFKRF